MTRGSSVISQRLVLPSPLVVMSTIGWRHPATPLMTHYNDPPSSISAARLGVMRVCTISGRPDAARFSSHSTSDTPTHSLIRCNAMARV